MNTKRRQRIQPEELKTRWELEVISAYIAKEAFGILEKMKRIASATLDPPEAGRRDKLAFKKTIWIEALAEHSPPCWNRQWRTNWDETAGDGKRATNIHNCHRNN